MLEFYLSNNAILPTRCAPIAHVARGRVTRGFRHWAKCSRNGNRARVGSPVVEYDTGGAVASHKAMGFDTLGMSRGIREAPLRARRIVSAYRREGGSRAGFSNGAISTADLGAFASPRGYTGHEHLDEVGLIHMNGRIYDPLIGRFLQMDPIIQDPYASQSFNRYSYVMNNPLMYTDPTGYSWWTEIRRPVGAIVAAIAVPWAAGQLMTSLTAFNTTYSLGLVASSEAGITLTAAGSAVAAAAGGFAAGGIAGGNIQSAVAGAFQAVALFGVGEMLGHGGDSFLQGNHIPRIVMHSAIGCAMSGVQGGSCGAGAAGAGFSVLAGPVIDNIDSFGGQVAAHAIAGGLGSRAAGGKFGNGAMTGAFGYLFNECAAGTCTSKFEQAMYDWWPGYKAGTLLYNQTMGNGSWTGWEVVDAASIGVGVAAKGLQLLKSAAPIASAASESSAAINLTEAQAANVARFSRKLPSGNTGVAVDKLGDGLLLTSVVPGRVPGSSAVYQKAIDAAGTTTGYWKTTFTPNGSVVHTKVKF